MFIFSLNRQFLWLFIGSLITLLCLSTPLTVSGDESFKIATSPDQRISLRANQASLRLILEQIARELNIEIQANIADDEKVTEDFNNVPLERALKLLSSNYITVTERKSGKIAKIFFLPQGQEAPRLITESRPPATRTATTGNNDPGSSSSSTTASKPNEEEVVSKNQDDDTPTADRLEGETPEALDSQGANKAEDEN